MASKVVLKPYEQIIKMAKDAVDALKAPLRASQMRKKAESEMCQLEEKLIDLDVKIQELCAAHPINFDRLIDALDEKALVERRKEQFADIIAQMFPDSK